MKLAFNGYAGRTFLLWGFCGLLFLPAALCQAGELPPAAVVARMSNAYERVSGYQTEVESSEFRDGRLEEARRFRYSFRKPDRLRIDMKTPHPGMRLVYPDRKGRVVVRFGGWLGALKVRFAPDNDLFATPSGQRIDQSDLGLLIRNIGRSIGSERHSVAQVAEEDGTLLLEVVAKDHYLPDILTRYRFVIDKTLWLPVAVLESTPEGRLKRTIYFRQLNTAPKFPEGFF